MGVVALLARCRRSAVAAAPARGRRRARLRTNRPRRPATPARRSWVADELRILRSEVESLRQRPDSSAASDVAALRAEVSQARPVPQAELDRRLGGAAGSGHQPGPDAAPGAASAGAVTFLGLGFALGLGGQPPRAALARPTAAHPGLARAIRGRWHARLLASSGVPTSSRHCPCT